jgi:hypothetical protein
MTTKIVSAVVDLIFAVVLLGAADQARGQNAPIPVDGCRLLAAPTQFNGKLVRVRGRVNSDFEHFDLRFSCDGYLQLETSTRETDIEKFGFGTVKDRNFTRLISALPKSPQLFGKDCIQCEVQVQSVFATIEALYRCHYDFPDCSSVSRFGSGSLVIKRVLSITVKPVTAPSGRAGR